MGQKVNVYAQSYPVVTTLHPNESQDWINWSDAAKYGAADWVTAKPLSGFRDFPGETILTVMNLRSEATPDGGRRIFYSVVNTGSNTVIAYAITIAWTDVV